MSEPQNEQVHDDRWQYALESERSARTIARLVALCVIMLVVAPVACTMHDNTTLTIMVAGGAHPLDARCAVAPGRIHDVCTLRAAMTGSLVNYQHTTTNTVTTPPKE